MRAPWLIDEQVLAGREHLNADFAAGFDDKQGHPDPSEDLAWLRHHGIGRDSTVIDLGAGTGQFAIPAARDLARVIAVDISPPMLDFLRRRVSEMELRNVDCVHAGFLTYEHAGVPADAVYTRNALHHLPDFWKAIALSRIAETLKPGGILLLRDLIYDFQPSESEDVFARWLDRAASDPSAGYTRADLAEHVRTEHSTFRWLLEPMLQAAGFKVIRSHFTDDVFGRYLCTKVRHA
jgi:SAM-dependent methyltransferase